MVSRNKHGTNIGIYFLPNIGSYFERHKPRENHFV